MTRALDLDFAKLACERSRRHPIRTYLWIPIERAAAMWFTPANHVVAILGPALAPAESWRGNPIDFEVTLGFALLNILYLGMAIASAWLWRAIQGILLIVTFHPHSHCVPHANCKPASRATSSFAFPLCWPWAGNFSLAVREQLEHL